MCIFLYPISDPQETSFRVLFAFERVYQRRDGGKWITLDVLIHNCGQRAIQELRIAYPHSLVDPRAAAKSDQRRAQRATARLHRLQLDRFRHKTSELSVVDHELHWPYRLGRGVSIVQASSGPGKLTIRRDDQTDGPAELTGVVKTDWTLSVPDDMNESTWLLFACNDITILDLKAPSRELEWLKPTENMWLRFDIQVPPRPRWDRVTGAVSRSIEHWQRFLSPNAVRRLVVQKVEAFSPYQQSFGRDIQYQLEAARKSAERFVPPKDWRTEIRDWRAFLYRQYGLVIEEKEPSDPEPKKPRLSTTAQLPSVADPPDCRRQLMPRWWRRSSERPREDKVYEFAFGSDHAGYAEGDGYILDLTCRASNRVYTVLPWLGLLGFLLASFNVISNLLGWFRK